MENEIEVGDTPDADPFKASFSDEKPEPTEAERAAASRLQQRRAALELARQRKTEMREMAPREANQRGAEATSRDRSGHNSSKRPDPIRDSYSTSKTYGNPDHFTRRRRDEGQMGGMIEVPEHCKRPGWDYQFVTIRVFNQPVDRSDIREFLDNGWRPVLAADMREMADETDADDAPIEIRGMRLYTRPMSLTMEARQEDYDVACRLQRDRTNAAAAGRASAIMDGIPAGRGLKRVPLGIEIVGEAG